MVGGRLDRFHGLGLRFIEISEDVIQAIGRRTAEYGHLGDIGAFRERLEPCQLDLNAPFDEPEFGEDVAERVHFSVIAAIQW